MLRIALIVSTFVCLSARFIYSEIMPNEPGAYISLQETASKLSSCLKAKDPPCVIREVSESGLWLGVDGPRISRRSLRVQLSSDGKLQCIFWGEHCGASGDSCTILSAVSNISSGDFSKAHQYQGHWQVDVQKRSSSVGCKLEFPLTFQQEGRFWKLVAVPYT